MYHSIFLLEASSAQMKNQLFLQLQTFPWLKYILNYLAYFSKTGVYNACVATNKRQLSSWMQRKQLARKCLVPLQAFKKVLHFLMIKAFLMQTIHCLLKNREAGRFGKDKVMLKINYYAFIIKREFTHLFQTFKCTKLFL